MRRFGLFIVVPSPAASVLRPRLWASAVRRHDVHLERGTVRFVERGPKIITKPLPHEFVEVVCAADAARVGVKATLLALRTAFAVQFDEANPDQFVASRS